MSDIINRVHISDKLAAWILSHFLFVLMVIFLLYDYNLWKPVLEYSGYCALFFFTLTLALNPLIKIKSYVFMMKLNRYRRQLGVASFSYALLHFLCFFIKRVIYGGWEFFFHPSILPVLIVGLPILFVMAITSNQYFVKKLSFKRWKALHQTVYIAEVAIIIHLVLSHQTKLAIMVFSSLIAIQLFRIYQQKSLNKNQKNLTV